MVILQSVWLAMEDVIAAQKLLEIARRHCKFALEHGDKDTSPERRKAIKSEIAALSEQKSQILASYT